MKPKCTECGEPFSVKRKRLGYSTCLKCGDKEAASKITEKSKRVAIAFNKGAYQYITPGTDLTSIGKKK